MRVVSVKKRRRQIITSYFAQLAQESPALKVRTGVNNFLIKQREDTHSLIYFLL